MKIRKESIDDLEPETGCHEHLCLASIRLNPALRSRSFERAHNRRPDSDNAPPPRSYLLNGTNHIHADIDPFGAHSMFFDLTNRHRLECPDTDMECDGRKTDPSLLQPCQQLRR